MTDLIAEVRQRRAETKAAQSRGEAMADCWTEEHIDALLAEIDQGREAVQVQNGVVLSGTRKLIEARAEIARLEHLLHGRSEAQLQENLSICVAQKYEAQMDAVRLRQEITRLRCDLDASNQRAREALAKVEALLVEREGWRNEQRNAVAASLRGDHEESLAALNRLEQLLYYVQVDPGAPATLEAEVERLKAEIKRLTDVCEDWARQSQLLQRDKDTLGAEAERLKAELSSLRAECQDEETMTELRAEIARLNDLLDGAEKQIDRMADPPEGAERERILALLRESEMAVAKSLAAAHYVDRFCKGEKDPHIVANIEGNWQNFLTPARNAIAAIAAKIGGER